MNENAIHGAPKKGENGGLPWGSALRQSWNTAPKSKVEDTWTKMQFMGLRKRVRMENCTKQSLRMTPNSKVEDAWTKTQFMGLRKDLEWRIALRNHYAWLQTRRWRTHERKRTSWGSEKGLRMENCTKQSLRMTPNSKMEDTWMTTQFIHVAPEKDENGELANSTTQ